MTVSDYIFDFLIKKGIDTLFMVSGGQAMYLTDAVQRRKEINYVCVHHEQSAGMSADAYSRISGKLGVALVTAGPGSINVVNGLVGGWTDSAPMMVISGQSALSAVKYQEQSGIRQYGVQGIYIRPFVEKATKFFVTVDNPGKIQYYMEKAYTLATSGRPGPVWIDVPLDVQRMQVPEKLQYSFTSETQGLSLSNRKQEAEKAWNMLKNSKRPLIVAGQGIRLGNAISEFRLFAEKHSIPIITTRLGIDCIESEHPLYVGRPGNYGERAANYAVQNADCILVLGSRLSTSSVGHDANAFGRMAKKIAVDIDEKELLKPGVNIDLAICDDVKQFLQALSELSDKMYPTQEWVAKCQYWKNEYPVCLSEYKNERPINSYYFTEKLSALTDKDTCVLVDTGSCFHVVCQTWKIKKGQRFLTTGGLSSMGYWAACLGACAANEWKNTIVVTGDGSLQMNVQELAVLAYHKFPIKVVIFNNNGYLLIRHTQRNFMEDRFIGEGPETGVFCPDALKLADSYGIKGIRVDNVDDLESKIKEMLDYQGPVIFEVMTPEWQLLIPRVSSEKKPDGTLISRDYEDMFPFLPEDEHKSNMISDLS